ncbi:MAG: hypothetical protein IPJ81_09290 [Chitinophagaceae bacterium]|nr:hypothetical protein [Chitinophagaceae bacterium]
MDPICTGGMIEQVELKKYNKTSRLAYQCIKPSDNYTKQIVKFINKEIPGKYEIVL